MVPKPNILLIMTDQHRPDHTGFGGNPLVKTPHLDALAAQSMRFDKAYVANPICMPNRSTILTGRMPSLHGTRYNGIPLDPRVQVFPRILRQTGYHTASIGKCHFQNMGIGPGLVEKAMAGLPATDARIKDYPAGWDSFEDRARHMAEYVAMPDDFYGLQHVELTVGHSDQCSGHYYQWAKDKGVDLATLQGAKHALEPGIPAHHVWRTAVPEDLYPSTYISERTEAYLRQHARTRSDQPFFAICSYPDPHHPFTPPGKYYDMYDPHDVELPRTFFDLHERSLPHYQRMLSRRGEPVRSSLAAFSPTEAEYREMAAKEFGMISMIDDGIGRVLACLTATGLAANTIVIFTADHGDMFGDHGVMLKGGMHYEGCVRVPLLIKVPGQPAGVSQSLVGSIDLTATILAMAGADSFYGMQSHDLAPVLADPGASLREGVLIEEDQLGDVSHAGMPLRMRTLVTDEARITLYQGHSHGELFDLTTDPGEERNLYGLTQAASLQALMMEKLSREMMLHCDVSPRPTAFA